MARSFIVILLFCSIFLFSGLSIAAHLPVEAFGNLPKARQVFLSPDGSKISFIRMYKGSTFLGVTNLATGETNFLLKTDNQKFKMGWYRWANNNVLLVSADYPKKLNGVKFTETRLLKVHADGKSEMESVIWPRRKERVPQFQNNIIDLLPDEPDHILMALDLKVANRPDVYKINLKTNRKRELVYKHKTHIYDWLTDRQHRVRLGYGRDETHIFFRLYDLQKEEWRTIWHYEIFDAPDITPLGFAKDPNILYIRANHNGRYAIFKVDLTSEKLERELVFSDPNYDVEGNLIYSVKLNDVIGVYHGEADNSKVYFDKRYKAFQTSLNKALPNAYNNVESMSDDERKYILFTSNPSSPGSFFYGDRDKGTLDFVVNQYPLLVEQPLQAKQKVLFTARDGAKIEGYITYPPENIASNGAGIILPHGGPMSRDYSGFDWFSQFFASRGYTVFQPNFRGSSGYGFEFEMASIQDWGGVMQDDLADAANWLIKNQNISKDKLCIVGASYGGYAALMSAVKQQDVFSCAASFAGVSDLEWLVFKARKFTNYKVVKKQIGNDSDKLEQRSPINFTDKVNIPVLLIHGEKDRIVDVRHSRRMYEELKDSEKDVNYIELKNGNHYLAIEDNRIKTLSAIESFLEKNLL